ncbi:hypothetical protein TELCIR_06571 [Teladorsagia circumcincta]|uniref:Uncharacterized protein n=1 Tax=Teladorsagia circumcincta TaxID=45464 RepID=A0A2G9UP93_TELCI|nr:hypothetical protein TELCIR_06571 [Teladorsagia circumcincta]
MIPFRYSLPFVYLLFLLFSVLSCRSILYLFVLKRNRDAKAFYYALLSIPKIAVIHALLVGWCTLPVVSVHRDVMEFMRKCSAFSCRRQNIDEGNYKSGLHLADAHGDAYGQHDSPGFFSLGYIGSKRLSCELPVAVICSSATHILHVDYWNKPSQCFVRRLI